MDNRQKINIDSNTKGILVYVKYVGDSQFTKYYHDWLLLIERASFDSLHHLFIFRHASYNIYNETFNITPLGEKRCWGTPNGYEFYLATKEERKFIAKLLAKKGRKFIKVLNKIVWR